MDDSARHLDGTYEQNATMFDLGIDGIDLHLAPVWPCDDNVHSAAAQQQERQMSATGSDSHDSSLMSKQPRASATPRSTQTDAAQKHVLLQTTTSRIDATSAAVQQQITLIRDSSTWMSMHVLGADGPCDDASYSKQTDAARACALW